MKKTTSKTTKKSTTKKSTADKFSSRVPVNRPATPQDIIDRARQYGTLCIDTLSDIVKNGSDAAKVSAANSLLDRGFGKVGQPIEVTGQNGKPISIKAEISPIIAEALKTLQSVDE